MFREKISICDRKHSPCDYNETVQPVPCVRHVGVLAKDSHGYHFDDHLSSEEGKDKVIESSKNFAPGRVAHLVHAGLVHPQCDAVEQYNSHAHAFKICEES